MSFSEHHFQSDDGLSLYYREYGAGPRVVLCLHGLTRNSKDFHQLAQRLSSHYRVISMDIRGRGQSSRDSNRIRYNPGQYVKDTWKLLDQLQLQHVSVIGTSLGGLMAMIMADQQPRRLRGIVLNDIGPELPLPAIRRIMSYAGKTPPAQDWEQAAMQVKSAYQIAMPNESDDFWREFVHLSYRENAAGLPEPDMDPAIGEALRHPPRAVKWLQWMNQRGWLKRVAGVNIDPWDSFRAVSMPCLLVHGAISDVLTQEIIDEMLVVNPAMQVVDIPGRGHAPLLDEPESLAAIDSFLTDLHDQ